MRQRLLQGLSVDRRPDFFLYVSLYILHYGRYQDSRRFAEMLLEVGSLSIYDCVSTVNERSLWARARSVGVTVAVEVRRICGVPTQVSIVPLSFALKIWIMSMTSARC